jgi:hypothetical protein
MRLDQDRLLRQDSAHAAHPVSHNDTFNFDRWCTAAIAPVVLQTSPRVSI